MKYFNIYRKSSLLFHYIILIFIFFFILSFYKIGFAENDDIVMALISSGSYSGSLDNHLVFINMIYGSVLNFLYYILPSVEWYTLSMVVISILSVGTTSWRIVESHQTKITKTIFLLFLLIVFIHITVFIQFTIIASMISITGVILINEPLRKFKYFGIVCIVLGSLIRFEAAFLVLIISAPIFILEILKYRKVRFNSEVKFLTIAVIISLFFKVIDYTYYNTDDSWSSYSQFNKIRGKINDNPNARMGMYNLPVNMSKEDYESVLSFFIDPAVIGYDALKSVQEVIDDVPSFTKLRHLYYLHYYGVPFFLILLTVVIIRYHKEKNSALNIAVVTLCIVFIGIICFVAFNATVKYRVFFSALVAMVTGLFVLIKQMPFPKIKKLLLVLVVLLTGYLFKAFYATADEKKYVRQIYNEQKKVINTYLEKKTNKLVIYGGDYLIFYGSPFMISSDFQEGQMFFTGWLTHIPFHEGKFDSFTYFIDHYGLFVLKRNYEQAVQQVARGIFLETGKKITPKIVAESSTDYIVEFTESEK